MRKLVPLLSTALFACGSQPASDGPNDASLIDAGNDAADSSDTTPADAAVPDAPVADVVNPTDIRPGDVPNDGIGVDTGPPDALVDDVFPDTSDDADAPLDVFDDVDVPSDAESDPVDDARPDVVEDAEPDAEPDIIEPGCDVDGDGVLSEACGGLDCDDTNSAIHPGRAEACNFYDDDCDLEINEDLDCRVYAHTVSQLYLVDPFLGTDESVTSVPSLFDFDTDPDGLLYGISSSRVLHTFDEDRAVWDRIGTFATSTGNGFAIDSERVGYMTAGNNVYTVDLDTAETILVGAMGGGFSSSGDCVVDKSDRLFMTSTGPGTDRLVAVSRSTGEGRLIGNIGYSGIWGLTAAWGHLFGFSSSGQIIEIDPTTGAGRLVHTLPGRSWYGAASSPDR